MEELSEIKGIGQEYSDLLAAAGINSVEQLRHQVPVDLYAKIVEINSRTEMVKQIPGLNQVRNWVDQAMNYQAITNHPEFLKDAQENDSEWSIEWGD